MDRVLEPDHEQLAATAHRVPGSPEGARVEQRDVVLSLRGLTKRFGGVVAVDGIDLDIRRGEFVTLLGPSGCGKTTTVRMVGEIGRAHV